MVPSAIQVPAYALYVLWGLVQPYLGSIFGTGPKVSHLAIDLASLLRYILADEVYAASANLAECCMLLGFWYYLNLCLLGCADYTAEVALAVFHLRYRCIPDCQKPHSCKGAVVAQEAEREETPAEKKRREKQERKQNRVRYR